MNFRAQDCISEFQNELQKLPRISEKQFYVLYQFDGTIFHTELIGNYFQQTYQLNSLIGNKITSFVSEPLGGHPNDKFVDSFFPESGTNSRVTFLFHNIDHKAFEYSRQVQCMASIIRKDNYYAMLVLPMEYYMERTKGRITEDMTALLDKNNNIIMACPSFLRMLSEKGTHAPANMESYIVADYWKTLLDREESTLQYLKNVKNSSLEPWYKWRTINTFKHSEWIPDINNNWNISDKEMAALPQRDNSIILYLPELDQFKNDVRINIRARVPSRGTLGALFHLDIYQAGGMTTAPDADGYSFSLREIKKNSTMQILLKKDAQPIEDIKARTDIFQTDGEFLLVDVCFEKCGGAFTVYAKDKQIASFFDINPVILKDNIYIGLLASRGTKIESIEIETRLSAFDISKIPKMVCDVKLYKLPGKTFEARIGNIASNFKKPVRYVYIKDVTHSRGLMEQLDKTVLRLNEELETAKKIQSMLSQISPPDDPRLSIASHYQPSMHVGGDLADIKKLSADLYSIIIYDVSGHGIGASLISAMAKLAFEHAISSSTNPSEILRMVNVDLCHLTHATLFLTAFVGIINLDKMEISYARAGHCLPEILSNRRSISPYSLAGGGPVLGHSKEFKYETFTENLLQGDRLFFYTDGLIEARNANELFYERSRMNQMLRSTLHLAPKLAADQLMADVNKHMRGEPFQDDVTFLMVDIK